MKNRNLISGAFLFAAGALISIYAVSYGLAGKSSEGSVGPGFLPLLTGLAIMLLSAILVLSTLKEKSGPQVKERFFPEDISRKKILMAFAGLISYGLILEYVGYILATLLFMIFMLKFMELQNRLRVALGSVVTATSFYLLFEVILKSQLPKGILWK